MATTRPRLTPGELLDRRRTRAGQALDPSRAETALRIESQNGNRSAVRALGLLLTTDENTAHEGEALLALSWERDHDAEAGAALVKRYESA